MNKIDTAIIGAGAAGMAAALKLHKNGIRNIMLIDRNPYLGGILRQCIHLGFGLSYFGEELSGPQYAERLAGEISRNGIPCLLDAMVVDVSNDKTITVTSSEGGVRRISARSIIFATGCRERTRENLEIPGSRPSGVFTAGLAQTLINLNGFKIGRKAVIQGSGDIGLIMARRLAVEGCEVVAVLERLPYLNGLIRNKVQCLDHFGIPLYLSSQISEICGSGRVTGVKVENIGSPGAGKEVSGPPTHIECDTVLFAVGLIPELELARKAGVKLDGDFYPDVNSGFESDIDGMFFCGNCLHINDLADNASIEGELAADAAARYMKEPDRFHEEVRNEKPFTEIRRNQSYTVRFFEGLKENKQTVCIICPNSCMLSENFTRCRRGVEYFRKVGSVPMQHMITSVFDHERKCSIPVKSVELLPAGDFKTIRKLVRESSARFTDKDSFSVGYKGRDIVFTVMSHGNGTLN